MACCCVLKIEFKFVLMLFVFSHLLSLKSDKGDSCPLLDKTIDKSVRVYYFGNGGKRTSNTLAFLYCDDGSDIHPEKFSLEEHEFYLVCLSSESGLLWKPEIVATPKCLQRCNISMTEGHTYKQIFLHNETDITKDTTIKSGGKIKISCKNGYTLYKLENESLSKSDLGPAAVECRDGSFTDGYFCLPATTYIIGLELFTDNESLPYDVYITLSNREESTEPHYMCGIFKEGIFNLNHFTTVPLNNTSGTLNATIEVKVHRQNEGTWSIRKLAVQEVMSGNVYVSTVDTVSSQSGIYYNVTLNLSGESFFEPETSTRDQLKQFSLDLNRYMKSLDKWKHCLEMYNSLSYPWLERRFLFQVCLSSEQVLKPVRQQQKRNLQLCPQSALKYEKPVPKTHVFTYVTNWYGNDIELLTQNCTFFIRIELTWNKNDKTDINRGKFSSVYCILSDETQSTGKIYFDSNDILTRHLEIATNQKILQTLSSITIGVEEEDLGIKDLYVKYVAVSAQIDKVDKVFVYNKNPVQFPAVSRNVTLTLEESGCKYPDNAPRLVHKLQKQIYLPGDTLSFKDFECEQYTVLSSVEKMTCLADRTWSQTVTCTEDIGDIIKVWKQQFNLWAKMYSIWRNDSKNS